MKIYYLLLIIFFIYSILYYTWYYIKRKIVNKSYKKFQYQKDWNKYLNRIRGK